MEQKKIYFVKGVSQYNTVRYFAEAFIRGLEKLGHEVIALDMDDMEDFNLKIEQNRNEKITAVIGFNAIGCDLKLGDGDYLWDYLKIPYYAILVDSPIYLWDRLGTKLNEMYCTVVDREHLQLTNKYFENIKKSCFLPHGGFTKAGNIKSFNERKYEVSFFGSYSPHEKTKAIIDSIESETEKTIIYNAIVKMTENENETMYSATKKMIDEYFSGTGLDKQIFELSTYADRYVRALNRFFVIKTLINNGIKVNVFGTGWDKFDGNDNLIIHGSKDYLECLQYMNESKIVLNVMPCFKQGSHERIFDTMLSGAVCVTDSSTFIDENFEDGIDLCLYSTKELNKLLASIMDILNNKEKWDKISTNGRNKAEQLHLWDNRAFEISKLFL